MAKIPPPVKGHITKLFKAGKSLPEIKEAVVGKFPKITLTRIRVVLKDHLFGLCDELWAEAVKIRDDGKCVISNKPTGLNSHHLIGRDNKHFRWTIINGVTLASDHHTLGNRVAAHGATDQTVRFAEWMVWNRREQWQWFLEHKENHTICKVDIFALLKIAEGLREYIESPRFDQRGNPLARKKITAMVPGKEW